MSLITEKLSSFKTLPNKLTAARIAAIPILLVMFPLTYQYVFPRIFCAIIFLLAALTDFFDGYLARKFNNESKLGELLDPIADKVLITAAVVVLTNAGYLTAFIAGLLLCREVTISGLRMAATNLGFEIKVSQLGRMKTVAQDTALFCLMVHTTLFIQVGYIAVWVALFLSYVSAFQYINSFWNSGREHFVEAP